MPEGKALFDMRRTFIDIPAIFDVSSPGSARTGVAALPALFVPLPQVLVEVASVFSIGVNVLIDPLMTDAPTDVFSDSSGNLLGAPLLFCQLFNHIAQCGRLNFGPR